MPETRDDLEFYHPTETVVPIETPAEPVAVEPTTHEPPPEPEPTPVEAATEPDPTEQQPGETEEQHKKRKGGYQRKLEAKDKIIERLTEQLAKGGNVPQVAPEGVQAGIVQPQPEGKPVAPNADAYQTFGEYTKALEEYTDKLTDWKIAQAEVKKAQTAKETTFKQKWAAAQREIPDFEEVMAETSAPMSSVMAQVVQESEVGPQLAYFLASKPEEAERIAGLSPWAAAKALGVIEAGLTAKAPVKPPQKPTQAPPPVGALTGRGATPSPKREDLEMY